MGTRKTLAVIVGPGNIGTDLLAKLLFTAAGQVAAARATWIRSRPPG